MARTRSPVRARLAPLSSLDLVGVWPQDANGQPARDDGGQQPVIVQKALPIFGHLIDIREIRNELGEEEIRVDKESSGSQETQEVLKVERHLLGIAVGEDQIVRPIEPGEHIEAPAEKNTNPVPVSVALNCLLGEPRMPGVALNGFDLSAGPKSQAERRIAEAGSDLENPLSRDSRSKHGEKRAAGRGVHAAARSVGFAMLVRREANVLEGVALALGGLDPLRNTLR